MCNTMYHLISIVTKGNKQESEGGGRLFYMHKTFLKGYIRDYLWWLFPEWGIGYRK